MADPKSKEDKSKKGNKVVDVVAPGTTPPNATSRPIIVSHGPIMKDPMFQGTAPAVSTSPPVPAPSARAKVVTPLAEVADDKAETPESSPNKKSAKTTKSKPDADEEPAEKIVVLDEPKPAKETAEAPVEEAPKADEKPTAAPKVESTTQDNEDDDENSAAVVDSVVEKAAEKKKQDQAEKETAEQQAKIAQLINEKKYFVPINVAKHKRTNRTLRVVLVILLLIAGGLGYAYYSGVLKLGN